MSAPIPATAWNSKEDRPLRVLIVDDSVVVRTVLGRVFSGHPEISVAHKTGNAEQALAFLGDNSVDIVLLDVEMPGQSGLAALPAILRAGAGAKVVILSGRCEEGSADAVEALALGASDIVSKPTSGEFGDSFSQSLLYRIGRIVGRGDPALGHALDVRLRPLRTPGPIGCLAIGASTGGIHALGQLFAGLEAPLGVPILLTQHLPPSFIPYFATQLGRMTALPVQVARQGELLRPDHVYIAPGEANLECRKAKNGRVAVTLTPERAASGSLPAVDPMFAAMAGAYGAGAVGIILTGMGRDGLKGAEAIVANGGWMVAQDIETSVVWGMPGSVARAGLASALMPPEEMLAFIARRATVPA